MRRFPAIAALLAGLLLLANTAPAAPELTWDTQTLRSKVFPGQKFRAEFFYENRGKEPVKVRSVEADCGCVTVELAPGAVIPPGKKGKLIVRMDPEGRTGQQLKRIWVLTDDSPPPGIELTLEVEIVEVFAFDPKDLEFEWKQESPAESRTLTIRRVQDVPAEITGVESTTSLLDALLDNSEADKGIWKVLIAPTSTLEDNEGVVFIRSNYPLEHPRTYMVLGRVLKK